MSLMWQCDHCCANWEGPEVGEVVQPPPGWNPGFFPPWIEDCEDRCPKCFAEAVAERATVRSEPKSNFRQAGLTEPDGRDR
jgi:hypothetical protein